MRAKVKGIYTIEMGMLHQLPPEDPIRFRIWVRAMVGPSSEEGEESFDIGVCTPKWIEAECESRGFVVGRHHLVVRHFDPHHITKVITQIIERCEGETWTEVAEKVSRIGYWDFEDYREKRLD